MVRVFLSYSSHDKLAVLDLATDLKKSGVEVWFDEWEIKVGDSVTKKIQTGLKDVEFLAVWLTNNSVNSGWVEREWQSKFSGEIQSGRVIILPLLAEECEIPVLLSDKKYADFRRNYRQGLLQLLEVLKPEGRGPQNPESHFQTSTHENALLHLQKGNYLIAQDELRKNLVADPNDTFLNVALGIALSNGKSLRGVSYLVAKEMHRNFSLAYDNLETRPFATMALVALKYDYFVRNSVKEQPPFLVELSPHLSSIVLSPLEKNILLKLQMSEQTRFQLRL